MKKNFRKKKTGKEKNQEKLKKIKTIKQKKNIQ